MQMPNYQLLFLQSQMRTLMGIVLATWQMGNAVALSHAVAALQLRHHHLLRDLQVGEEQQTNLANEWEIYLVR